MKDKWKIKSKFKTRKYFCNLKTNKIEEKIITEE